MIATETINEVCCILINYNSSKYTINCVESIIENTRDTISYEIVIIDNNSDKVDYDHLKNGLATIIAQFNNVSIIRSKINTGFGAGNMLGVQYAKPCKYYAFINNDTLMVSDTILLQLKDFLKSNLHIGICGPQMLDEQKNNMTSIGHFASPLTQIIRTSLLEKLAPSTFIKRRGTYTTPTKVDYVQGAFMFINAESFHKIGGFDNNLFIYYEESDISVRMLKELNKETYLVPNLKYIHFEGQSINRKKRNLLIKSEQKIALMYYLKKHFSFFEYKCAQVFLAIKYFFSSIVKPKNWNIFIIMFKGGNLKESLKQKQQINRY